jgi:hypothetical protein
VPTTPNGTITLARGNSGATTANIATIDASGNFTTILNPASIANGSIVGAKLSGNQYGSAPIFGVRAWVNFDGTRNTSFGVDATNTNRWLRGVGNVSSVLRTGTGRYTITFANPMPNEGYAVICSTGQNFDTNQSAYGPSIAYNGVYSTSSVDVVHGYFTTSQAYSDPQVFNVMVIV